MRIILIPIFLFLFLLPFSVSATTYYVDATGGNDTWGGTSESTPWKTLSKVQNTLHWDQSGNNVYLKRGEVWREDYITDCYGTQGQLFTIGAYGTGDAPKIMGSEQITGWENQGGNIWRASCANHPGAGDDNGPVFFINTNGDGKTHWGMENTTLDAEYEWYWSDGYLYCYSPADPDTRYDAIEAAMRRHGMSIRGYTYITGIEISYTARPGIASYGGHGSVIDGCHIHHNGPYSGDTVGHGDNIIWMGSGWTIKNNILHDAYAHNIQHMSSGSTGDIIEGNICYNSAHGQIDVKHVGPTGSVANQIIRYNLIYTDSDFPWKHIHSVASISCLADMGYYLNNTQIYGNIIYNFWQWGIYLERGVNGAEIYNNVIYGRNPLATYTGAGPSAIMLTGWSTKPPRNVTIKNNIIAGDLQPSDQGIGLWYDNGLSMIDECDYNSFYITTGHFINADLGDQNDYYDAADWDAWKTLSGFDTHSLWNVDPEFENTSSFNFHLQSSSPAIDNGTDVGLTMDFEGNPIPVGSGPDIGAYEYVSVSGPTYYVDSDIGNDANNCSQALNSSTPKRTVNSIMSCNPGAGDIVKFRGTFTQGIYPTRSGEVLYAFQPIQGVYGSTVTFSNSISGLNPATDYVTIYNSRKGNSGAFAVVSFSGNTVTVNTSDLPGGLFLQETEADPGTLQAAILRPVHFTAWDKQNPPVFNTQYQTYHAINQRVIMVSYIKSISGDGYVVWPAIEIDGSDGGNSDYQIIDHLEIINAECGIATESGPGHAFQSNYNIVQFNNVHDVGFSGSVSDEAIYFGWAFRPDLHHDYVQIMYNKVGPHKLDYGEPNPIRGDGIELKQSAHNATVFGNEVVGIRPIGCADAPIRSSGAYGFIANNYVHDIYNNDLDIQNPDKLGCGISIISDRLTNNSKDEAYGTIVENNIVANVKDRGIRVLDADNIQVLNNVVYNIIPKSNCDSVCVEEAAGIFFQNWQGSTEDIIIKNNIVQSSIIGIGRYIWGHDEYPVSIDSDYNLVFNTTYPFRGSITQNTHDLLLDPMFVDPENGDFHLQSSSPAIDNGTDVGLAIDFDSVSRPQGAGYDIGAYEYTNGGPPVPIPGDLNNDDVVDIYDLIFITPHFGKTYPHPEWNATADTIPDNEVDIYDVVFVASRFTE